MRPAKPHVAQCGGPPLDHLGSLTELSDSSRPIADHQTTAAVAATARDLEGHAIGRTQPTRCSLSLSQPPGKRNRAALITSL